ncbi:MAG TPA: ATP-dependent zinc metalloprotease FtsH [Caldisericia bacterium]|nr:ATP-dependent zinc metalloprotease FtsH [Caldisericia bacterium]HPO28803.1 ATP-dependent zinc metalloprotease FtsH [Caldisericia bacterium]
MPENNKKKQPGINFLPMIILILIVIVVSFVFDLSRGTSPIQLKYNEYLIYVDEGKINTAEIRGNKITGKLKDGSDYVVTIYPELIPSITDKLAKSNVQTQLIQSSSSDLWGIIINIGTTLLILGLFWYMLSRAVQSSGGNQVFNFGKSTAKLFMEDKPKISFKDVAGLYETKQELIEIVEFLREPKKFTSIGAKIPKGVLLVGPPGCGKTLLARAISGEAKVPFFSVSGSEFVEMFVGVGASRVRDLFMQARKYAPSLIFIDEIDAVGRHRGAGLRGGHDEREQTLNQLLVEMDGYDPRIGIIVIAATNRPDILDPALLRPGRFDRHIVVNMPDRQEREEILKLHAQNKPIDEQVDFTVLARRTAGFTGADLENLLNEAAILTARRNKKKIEMSEIEEAIDRVLAGPEKKSRVVSEKEKRIIAIHEVGHAAVIRNYPDLEPVHKISIVSRGMALGYTLQLPYDDKYLMTKSEIFHKICSLLGGRAAEEVIIGEITTGAENDFEQVTKLAMDMVTKYGMSNLLGPRSFGKENGPIFLGKDLVQEKDYSESTGKIIDEEVNEVIEKAYKEAKNIIDAKKTEIIDISNILLQREYLEGEELDKYLDLLKMGSEQEEEEKEKVETT